MINKVRVVVASNRELNVDKAVTVNYSCQYEYGGKVRMIDSFGTYRELNGSEVGKRDNEGNITGHTPSIIQFTKTAMATTYTYEENENSENFSNHDKNIKNIVENFWGKNPLCLKNGKSHTPGQSGKHFDLLDFNIATINSVNSFKDKLRAANVISEMSHAKRCDVAFFYGLSPVGKSEEELLVELGDGEKGYCLQAANLDNFLKVWVDGKSDDRDLVVTLKRAVSMGVIEKKVDDGRNSYFLGDTFLGSDELSLISWVRQHPRDFSEFIERKVVEGTKKEEKVISSIKVSNEGKVDLDAFNMLKKQAKELYIEGYMEPGTNTTTMKYDTLKKAVDAALLKKKSVVA